MTYTPDQFITALSGPQGGGPNCLRAIKHLESMKAEGMRSMSTGRGYIGEEPCTLEQWAGAFADMQDEIQLGGSVRIWDGALDNKWLYRLNNIWGWFVLIPYRYRKLRQKWAVRREGV